MTAAAALHTTGHRPRLSVCLDDRSRDAVARELAAAGWVRDDGDHPRADRATTRLLWVGRVDDRGDIPELAERLVQGVSVVVGANDELVACEAFDQCRRLADAEWFDRDSRPFTDRLEQIHLSLLLRIEEGDSVTDAARACHLSERTAARRLAEARDRLGVRSTAEAAARLAARLDELRS